MPDLALDIIATRTVWDEDDEGEYIPITINIYCPHEDEEYADTWECMHQILGNGDDMRRIGFGVDPIQALYYSLKMAGIELQGIVYQTPQEENEYGMWNEKNNFGFPRFKLKKVVDTDFAENDEGEKE